MSTVSNWLLCNRVRDLAGQIAAAPDEATAEDGWRTLESLLEEAGADEIEEIALPVLDRSLEDVHALLDAWEAGTIGLAEWDRAVLKRALKAYRKRLKIMRLDDESSGSRDPLSRGDESSITGVRPPEQYAQEIWDLLIAQGKLRDVGHGLLELTTH
jgi:hypothetical protein